MTLFRSKASRATKSTSPLLFSMNTSASTILIIVLQVISLLQHSAYAAVYIHNETYPSMPGLLFGRFMEDNRLYQARLQFFPENPYLCDDFDSNATYFDYKNNNSINSNNDDNDYDENSSLTNNEYSQNNGLVFPAEPIALLASRGNCTFARKAAVAESIHPSVQFLIVYMDDMEGEDKLFSLAAEEDEDTRLILLSVSYRTGQALRQYIAEQPEAVRQQQGGPLIAMDNDIETLPPLNGLPPTGMSTVDVLLVFGWHTCVWAIACCCFCACAALCGRSQASAPVNLARLMEAGALQSTSVETDSDATSKAPRTATEKTANVDDNDDKTLICAICLDDEMPKAFSVLPCQHRFHTACIIPWLTERHANCPLCKYDVQQYVLDHEAAAAV